MVIPEVGHPRTGDRRRNRSRIALNRIAFNRIAFNRIALRCWLDVPNARRRFGKRGTKGARTCPTPAFANGQSSAEASGTIGILHTALASRLDARDSGLAFSRRLIRTGVPGSSKNSRKELTR